MLTIIFTVLLVVIAYYLFTKKTAFGRSLDENEGNAIFVKIFATVFVAFCAASSFLYSKNPASILIVFFWMSLAAKDFCDYNIFLSKSSGYSDEDFKNAIRLRGFLMILGITIPVMYFSNLMNVNYSKTNAIVAAIFGIDVLFDAIQIRRAQKEHELSKLCEDNKICEDNKSSIGENNCVYQK